MTTINAGGTAFRYGQAMIHRHTFRAALAASGIALVAMSNAEALEQVPYDPVVFAAAQESGRPIIVGFWATWCATCQTQIRAIDALADDPRFDDLLVFVVDYDTQKPVMRLFHVMTRSQMLSMHGEEETGRLVQETDPDLIEAFMVEAVEATVD